MTSKPSLQHDLQNAVLAVYSSFSKPRILAAALEAARTFFAADESTILLPAARGGQYDVFSTGTHSQKRLRRSRVAKLQGFEKWVFSTGTPFILPGSDSFLQDAETLRRQSLFSVSPLMAVALLCEGQSRGVWVITAAKRSEPFQSEDLETLGWLARHAARALDTASRFEAEQAFNLELGRQIRAAAAQLRAANETLRQTDAAKSELISTVAHELRTPITSIAGFTKLLLKGQCGPLNPEQLEFCRIIYNNSGNLERLIIDLLDLTRLEQGRLEMHPAQLSLTVLVKEAALSWRAGNPESGDRLQLELPDTTVQVNGDRVRLLQVINNLLSNAHKYSPPGTPIRLRLAVEAESAVLTVRNQGEALTPEQLERIFEKFYRIRSEATRNISGSGLGLAITRSIVQAHGGSIQAQNAPEGGTELCLSLPCHPARTDAMPEVQSDLPASFSAETAK